MTDDEIKDQVVLATIRRVRDDIRLLEYPSFTQEDIDLALAGLDRLQRVVESNAARSADHYRLAPFPGRWADTLADPTARHEDR